MKDNMTHSHEHGEGTVIVQIQSGSSAIGMHIGHGREQMKNGPPRRFTDEEVYNITRHGVAPDGYRLRFVSDLGTYQELPIDQVPFFKTHEAYLKEMSKSGLNELLARIPSLLFSSEGSDMRPVEGLYWIDRYDAALKELASRGGVPEPFAARAAPTAPPPAVSSVAPPEASGAVSGVPNAAARSAPPKPPVDEAARAEIDRQIEYAKIYLEALEKRAKKDDITPATRSLIAQRLRQLRILRNPNLLAPPTEPDGDNGPPAAPR